MCLPTTCLSGDQTDLSLPATAGPSVSPSAQHTSTDKAHVSCTPSSKVRQGSKDVHSGPHQALSRETPRPEASDMCALPIRPPAGYVHSILVPWPLPHQERPAHTSASGKTRENILSEFETTAKAAVEITEARGEGASFEEKGHPDSLFLR